MGRVVVEEVERVELLGKVGVRRGRSAALPTVTRHYLGRPGVLGGMKLITGYY
jgi:hypothetical protein